MPRKRGVGCFGSRSNHPEIRYGIDPKGMQPLQEFSQPMPEESELNAKFAEIVVSQGRLKVFAVIVCHRLNLSLFSFMFVLCFDIYRGGGGTVQD